MPKAPNQASSTTTPAAAQGEPSLGPACGFFFVFFAVIVAFGIIAVSFWLGTRENQTKAAAKAIRSQLIPWIKDSSLTEQDRESMVERLTDLLVDLDAERLTSDQLRRLSLRLDSQPVFQWGVIEAIEAQAEADKELSESEKESIRRLCDRLLRSVYEGKMAMTQLSYIVQNVATTERLSQRLNIRQENKAADLRSFWQRAETVCDKLQVSKEPLEKTPSQVLRMMLDEALH
jgi:hypothetical protein